MKKALLVGINDYQGEINDLPSCIEDTLQFKKLLCEQYGFVAADIRMLHDTDATSGRVLQEFSGLTAGAQPEDTLIFFYSGHGCQVPTENTLEEALVLYDQPLLDDALAQMCKDLPPGVLTIVLDSCFSGGMEKPYRVPMAGGNDATFLARVKHWIPSTQGLVKSASLEETLSHWRPFGALMRRQRSFDPMTGRLDRVARKPGESGARLNAVLFSACQEDETAAASTPATTGMSAFTYAVTRSVQRTGNKQTNGELYQNALAELKALRLRQTPMLLCPPLPQNSEAKPFVAGVDIAKPPATGMSSLIASLMNRLPRPASKAVAAKAEAMSAEQALDHVIDLAPEVAKLSDLSPTEKSLWTRISRALAPITGEANATVRTLVTTLGTSVFGLAKGQNPEEMTVQEALEAVTLMAPVLAERSPDDKGFWSSLSGALRSVVRNPIVRSVGEHVVGTLLKGQAPAMPADEAIDAIAALAPALAARSGSPMEKGFWSSVAGALRSVVRNPVVQAIGDQYIRSLVKGQEPATISAQEALEAVAALAPTLAAAENASEVEKGFWSSVVHTLRPLVRNPVVRSLAETAGSQVLQVLGKGQATSEISPEEAIEAIATLAPTLAASANITAMEKGFWSSIGHALSTAIRNPFVRAMNSQVLGGLTKGQAPEVISAEEALEAVAALAPTLAAAEGASLMEKGFWSSIGHALSTVVRNPIVRTAVGVVAPRVLGAVIPGGFVASVGASAVINAITKSKEHNGVPVTAAA